MLIQRATWLVKHSHKVRGTITANIPGTTTAWDTGSTVWDYSATLFDYIPGTVWDLNATFFDAGNTTFDTPHSGAQAIGSVQATHPAVSNLADNMGRPLLLKPKRIPRNPRTAAQQHQRAKLAQAMRSWQADRTLCTLTSRAWRGHTAMTSYNRWVSYYLNHN